ncbi:MAG TPA: hypothetical protein VK324_04345 [Tepidisphaeraceae bacterium]|nr:hypothetical protein [Tepidisphaeraceae bacterium]
MAKKKIEDYPEIQKIIDRLKGGKPSEMIAVFVPSHDRKEKLLQNKEVWENQTLKLFGKLFTGATAFTSMSGVYQPTRDSRPLYDNPTMVQSLTATENLENEDNLIEFAEFCRNMGQQTNQASIGVVINNKFIDITIDHDD